MQYLNTFQGCLTTAQSRISAMVDTAGSNTHSLSEFQHTVKLLMARSEDAENRLWHDNVHVVGPPRESWRLLSCHLCRVFLQATVGSTSSPPRPFLDRFLNFWDRDLILAEASKRPQLKFELVTLHLFPDLQRIFCSFVDVRKRLWEKGLRSSHLFF